MGFNRQNAPNCEICPHRKGCFYNLLDASSKKDWNKLRVANAFKDDDIVFFDGEKPTGLYVVCTGKVKIYKSTRTGQQLITRVVDPGQLLGYRSLLAGDTYAGTAMAMQASTVSLIETEPFFSFLKKHIEATLSLLRQTAQEVRESEDRTRDMAYKPARARLSEVLLKMKHQNGDPKPVVAGLKRKELAEMAGLTIETTVRLLNDFEKRGLLRRELKSIVLLDAEKLKVISASNN